MKEPKDATMLAARLARAYPSLSAYSSATLAEELCRIERAQRRHAERCCSGEDGGYVKRSRREHSYLDPHDPRATVIEHDPEAEERAGKRIERRCDRARDRLRQLLLGGGATADELLQLAAELQAFRIERQGDPRGAVLKVRLPGEAEAAGV